MSFSTGTLAGAGSFNCEACGFAVALHERDEVPDCPSCGGTSFGRSSMFGAALSNPAPRSDEGHAEWLEETRRSLSVEGDYLAYDLAAAAVEGFGRAAESFESAVEGFGRDAESFESAVEGFGRDVESFESVSHATTVELDAGWTRIGRSLTAEIRFDDPTVSRRHALVYSGENGAKVLDDRSLNGVFCNGERVEVADLSDGDTLTIGRFNLHFIRLEGEHASPPGATSGARS